MAINATRTEAAGRTYRFVWETLTESILDGGAVSIPGASDRSVQVMGTFGGTTVTIQGSNERTPTVWATLHDVNGDALTFTSAGIEVVAENTTHIRPLLAGGAGVDVDVIMLVRSTM